MTIDPVNIKKTEQGTADVRDKDGQPWVYSDMVKDHFFNPRNIMLDEVDETKYNGIGRVGSPACGDEMKVWLKIDSANDRIIEFKWRTFGCGSAIASTSMLSVMVEENGGTKIDEALKITPDEIMKRLDGLPSRKIHCSVLGDKALRSAINAYFRNTGQFNRVLVSGAKMIDANANVTDKDIEEAVIDGCDTLEKVQAKTKVGIGNPDILLEVEQLIRFYKEKYFG